MNILTPISEILNYILFSFLVGHVALQFVSDSKKPKVSVPKQLLLLSTLGIIVCSLIPVLKVIFYFSNNMGFRLTTLSVLTNFQIGKAWVFTCIIGILLWLTLYFKGSKYLQSFWLLLMIGAVGYASHVSSLSFWTGFLSHSIHFLMVSLWSGIILHVGWFSKGEKNWSTFLQWFTPLAIGCLTLVIGSGLILMFKIIEPKEYFMVWAIPYGQMLLLKHISLIPVLAFALINGILTKKISSSPSFNPKSWVQVESIVLLFVFAFTGVLGTLSPPDNINFMVIPKWIERILGQDIGVPLHPEINLSFEGIILFAISLIFIAMIIMSFFKKSSPFSSLLFTICFIVSLYLALMMNITL
ncbi:copper resistance D family protein (plasmid) [Priestia megaterium]|uniref:copper resistance D family protein n=1 Tax=Priestia TaxID=2800373 RepID=UPI00196B0A61|nr:MULTISPECIES: CopD family protein [Priestia]MCW1048958.1 CopD family protein [Priestia sp. JV24]QSF42181.1 CopD family protein [Priestia megaterium]